MSGGWRAQNADGIRPTGSGLTLRARRAIWLAMTILTATIVVVLLSVLALDSVAPIKLVAIGMTADHPSFPARQVARTTASRFAQLHKDNIRQFPELPDVREAELHGDRLLSSLKDRLKGTAAQTLLVYFNCHGGLLVEGDQPAAQFITVNAEPDCLASNRTDQLVSAKALLDVLGSVDSRQVLVLLDGYTTPANWRTGQLGQDFPSVISRDAEAACRQYPNLHVICACGPGETTAMMDELTPAEHVLGHFSVKALSGDADGWVKDPITGTCSNDQSPRNDRVSVTELVAYLQNKVNNWSKDHQLQSQTVQYFGSAFEQDCEIVQISRLDAAAEAVLDAVQESPEDAGRDEKSNTAETGEPGIAANPASVDQAADGAAEKSAVAVSTTGSTSAAEAPTSSQNVNAANPTDEDTTDSESAGKQLSARLKQFTDELEKAWMQRDELRRTRRAAVVSPREWRRLNYLLVRAEEQIRLSEDSPAETELQRIRRLMTVISNVISDERTLFSGSLGSTSLAAIRLKSESTSAASPLDAETTSASASVNVKPGGNADADVQDAARLATFETQWQALSSGPAEEKMLAEFRNTLRESPAIRSTYYGRLFQLALESNLGSPAVLERLTALLELCVPTQTADGVEPIPAELELLRRICTTGAQVTGESLEEFGLLARNILILRQRFEAAVVSALDVYELLRPAIIATERHLVATERWLLAGEADFNHVRQWEVLTDESLDLLTERLQPTLQQAFRLRAELLCELPAYAGWCARSATETGVMQRSRLKYLAGHFAEFQWTESQSYPLDVYELLSSGHEKRLLRLVDLTRRINRLLTARPKSLESLMQLAGNSGTAGADPTGNLTALLSEVETLWSESGESFRGGFLAEMETLANDVPSPFTRSQVLAALEVPWIPASLRTKLRSRLSATTRSGFAAARGVRETPVNHGEWEAFWCLQVLCTGGLNQQQAESLWKEYQTFINEATEDSQTLASLKTGRLITERWNQMTASLNRYSPRAGDDETSVSPFELAFCAHPADAILPEAIDPVRTRQTERVTRLAADRARMWALRQHSYEGREGFTQLASAWQRIAGDQWKSGPAPRLGHLPSELRLPSGAGSTLDIPVQQTAESQSPLNLRLLSVSLKVEENGKQIPEKGLHLDPAIPNVTRTMLVTLQEGAPKRPQTLTVTLEDGQDAFPWDIRQVTVNSPVDAADWRVVWMTPAEGNASEIAGQDVWQLPVAARDRNLDSELVGDVDLRLPPNASVIQLHPFLIPPPGTHIDRVDVLIRETSTDGEPAAQPLAVFNSVQVSDSGRPILLRAAAPTEKPPADAPVPQAAPGTDITEGLIFEIQIPGEPPVRHRIRPTIRDARDLLAPPTVSFREGVLTVALRPGASVIDPLIPEVFPVTLRLPPELVRLNPTGKLEGTAGSGGPVTLSAKFNDVGELDGGRFPIFLDVAGVPHAYSWYVRHEFPPEALDQELRIEAPADQQTVSQGEPVQVQLGVYSRRMEERLQQRGGWQIEYSDSPVGVPGIPRRQFISIDREHAHQIRMTYEEGVWKFETTTANHTLTIPTANSSGVFHLQARLQSPPGVTRRVEFEKQLTFAVDDKLKAPLMPKLADTRGFLRQGGVFEFLVDGGNMYLTVEVSDFESGVKTVSWGFDRNDDGTLTENEIVSRKELEELQSGKRTVLIEIPPESQPEQPGKSVLLISCQDGLGTSSRDSLAVPIELRLPDKLGTLTLKMKYYQLSSRTTGTSVELRREGGPPVVVSKESYAAEVMRKLIVGKYTVVIVRNGQDREVGQVTITEGVKSSHSIEF